VSVGLPDEPPEHPVWAARYADKPRGPFTYEVFDASAGHWLDTRCSLVFE
jgi:hypothetical protein